MRAGKVWGTTEEVEKNTSMEFHRLEFKSGYVCSEHLHETKWNGFFVESGEMIVRVWQNDRPDEPDETRLLAGDYMKVPPSTWHQFEGVISGIAFEVYWSEFNGDDIIRRTTGCAVS